jgi:alanine dehydrogenase
MLANEGFLKAAAENRALAKGVNTYAGHVTYEAIAEAFGLKHRPLDQLL